MIASVPFTVYVIVLFAAPAVSDAKVYETNASAFPRCVIAIDAEHTIRRTSIENDPGTALAWVIVKDGETVLSRNARKENHYKYFLDSPGVYTVYVHQFIDGAYRVISNVNSYTVTASREDATQSVPRDTQDHPCHIFVDENRIVNRGLVDGELTARLVWTVKRDGELVLRRNAKSQTQFRYFGRKPGRYEVSVQKIVDGDYRTVSNVLSYELPR